MREFICVAKVGSHYLNDCNRLEVSWQTHEISALGEDAVYEALAKFRIKREQAAEDDWGDGKVEVQFGPVREIARSFCADPARIESSAPWVAHSEAMRREEEAESAAEAQRVQEKAQQRAEWEAASEERDRAVWLELQARFGGAKGEGRS